MPKPKASSTTKAGDDKKGKGKKQLTATDESAEGGANTANSGNEVDGAPSAKTDPATGAASELQTGALTSSNLLNQDGQSVNKDQNKSSSNPMGGSENIEDVKYEEPLLTSIIVEQYEGEKVKGLFEGFGKAVYQGGHVYEGEFRGGMMNGRGKYTWSNGIVYEGDFLNNEIIGTGVYIWPESTTRTASADSSKAPKAATYEGQVFKSLRHGFGTFKSARNSIKYIGEWRMGKIYGKGKMTYDKEGLSYYEGDWINNKKFGYGIRHYKSGNIYEGMWVNDVRHGEGTMRWFDKNQIYAGQWENGLQNGMGEQNWYSARVYMTQYALRNTYYGMFVNGKRQGQGTFLYADGAKYEGGWVNDLKDGWGKFTYKDGKIYEGYFEEDKMTNSPTFKRTSKLAEEISKVKTRIPSAGTTLNLELLCLNQDAYQTDFHLKLNLKHILNSLNSSKQNLESEQAHKTVLRYLDIFKHIYRYYSQLGFETNSDNSFVLNRMQFWRLLKDCKIHLNEEGITLMEFDRLISEHTATSSTELHCPYDKILIREFFDYIVIIAFKLFSEEFASNSGLIISSCIEKLVLENLIPNACNVQGNFYQSPRKTMSVLTYMVQSYEIYRFLSIKKENNTNDYSLKMRDMLRALYDFKLIDGKSLTTRDVIESLAADNCQVFDSENAYNLEFEITFLEFFEALIGCANKLFKPKQKASDKIVVTDLEDKTTASQIMAVEQKSVLAENSTAQIVDATVLDDANAKMSKEADGIVIVEQTVEEKSIPESSKSELELQEWIEKNHDFFIAKLFPAAQHYEEINQRCSYWI